jgi:NADH dehydrogenase
MSAILGLLVHDVLLTSDEYHAMADGLADVEGPSTGSTSVLAWLARNGERLGLRYANELTRHFDTPSPVGVERQPAR